MWLIASYEPTSLFSLRYSNATTAGAKSLLVPSPYTVKMALVVAAIRWKGEGFAREQFEWLRDLEPLKIRPSRYAVVNRCFMKYQSRNEEKGKKPKNEQGEVDPSYVAPIGYSPTVGFREYVYFQGAIDIAFPTATIDDSHLILLRQLLVQVNTFGKRGSFFQFIAFETKGELPPNFSQTMGNTKIVAKRILQPLDDMASSLTFDKVDVTNDKAKVQRVDRQPEVTLLPMQARRFAAGWALYERETYDDFS